MSDHQYRVFQARALSDPEAMRGLLVSALRLGLLSMHDLSVLWAMGMRPRGIVVGENTWIGEIAGDLAGLPHHLWGVDVRYEEVMQYPARYVKPIEHYDIKDKDDFDAALLLCRASENILLTHINVIQTNYEVVTDNTRRIDRLQDEARQLLNELQTGSLEPGTLMAKAETRWNRLRRAGASVNMVTDDSGLARPGRNHYIDYVAQSVVSFLDCTLNFWRAYMPYNDFQTICSILPTFELPAHARNDRGLPRTVESVFYLKDLVWDPMILWFLRYRGVLGIQ